MFANNKEATTMNNLWEELTDSQGEAISGGVADTAEIVGKITTNISTALENNPKADEKDVAQRIADGIARVVG